MDCFEVGYWKRQGVAGVVSHWGWARTCEGRGGVAGSEEGLEGFVRHPLLQARRQARRQHKIQERCIGPRIRMKCHPQPTPWLKRHLSQDLRIGPLTPFTVCICRSQCLPTWLVSERVLRRGQVCASSANVMAVRTDGEARAARRVLVPRSSDRRPVFIRAS